VLRFERFSAYPSLLVSTVQGVFDDQIFIGGWRQFILRVNKDGICTRIGKNGNANTQAQLSEFAEFRRKQNSKEHELIKYYFAEQRDAIREGPVPLATGNIPLIRGTKK